MNKYKFLEALSLRGYSQKSFADKVNENYKSFNNKINGKVKLSTDDAMLYAKILGIESSDQKCEIFLSKSSQK